VLFLFSIVAGGFGEFYVPSRLIVAADAAATARNLTSSGMLFRLGFVGYLVEAVCDIGLTLVLYVLLRPVNRNVALLALLFRVVSTAVFAFGELFYFAAPIFLGNADFLRVFSRDQRNAFALLSLKAYGYGGEIFMVFYGAASILLGYLMYRSGFLPRFLGALLALAGIGFVARNFALVLAPGYPTSALLLPMPLAALALTAWFLTKGVDVQKWKESAAASGGLTSESSASPRG
jgi:hypothetical protein